MTTPCPHCQPPTHQCPNCPTCTHTLRTNLHTIHTLTPHTLNEATHQGTNSTAAMLAGPTANPEAWHHRQHSALNGHTQNPEWLQDCRNEPHPQWTLTLWEHTTRQHLGHPPNPNPTLNDAYHYLTQHLTRITADPTYPTPALATALHTTRLLLENTLAAGHPPRTTKVPCLNCGTPLHTHYTTNAADDHHQCPHCRRVYTAQEFTRAKAHLLATIDADRFVPVADAAQAVERSQFTVRTWVRRGLVVAVCTVPRPRRLLVWWPDVRDTHRERRVRVAG